MPREGAQAGLVLVKAAVERKCIVAMNDGGARVAVATGKQLIGCIGRPGASVEACTAADPKGTIAKARAKAAALAEKHCAQEPSFGPAFGRGRLRCVRQARAPPRRVRCEPRRGADFSGDGSEGRRLSARGRARPHAARPDAAPRVQPLQVARARARPDRVGGDAGRLLRVDRRQGHRRAGETAREARGAQVCRHADRDRVPRPVRGRERVGSVHVCAAAVDVRRLPRAQCGRRARAGLPPVHRGRRDVVLRRPPRATRSIAHEWDEALLSAIRLDTPGPTVHARNLFHLSALMWDAWRAYDGGGKAYLTDKSHASTTRRGTARSRSASRPTACWRIASSRVRAATRTQARAARPHDALGYDATTRRPTATRRRRSATAWRPR